MISDDVELGEDVTIYHPQLVNLYGCKVGNESRIGAFVEIQKGAFIGARSKISSHTFICEGVTIEDGVFVGHGVMFTNDIYPRALNSDGNPQSEADWAVVETRVGAGASIGSNATILCGITIGRHALVGAGPWSPEMYPISPSSRAFLQGSRATVGPEPTRVSYSLSDAWSGTRFRRAGPVLSWISIKSRG
jgi:UDP-2-acetamido-3-amino-2,3-dideoxy-glucuronate N-acetyltransferase